MTKQEMHDLTKKLNDISFDTRNVKKIKPAKGQTLEDLFGGRIKVPAMDVCKHSIDRQSTIPFCTLCGYTKDQITSNIMQ